LLAGFGAAFVEVFPQRPAAHPLLAIYLLITRAAAPRRRARIAVEGVCAAVRRRPADRRFRMPGRDARC
jgi:hypothetical protein